MIPFNRPNLLGKELEYIKDAFEYGKVSGDGKYTKLCHQFIETRFKATKALLTTSCTHALDMAAILIDIKPGDEVILPSYTFVSTVNAFVLRGARPVFCDIRVDNFNIDETRVPNLISPRTKAIIPVHYAGIACEMDEIMKLAQKHQLFVVEDAAQGVNAKYKDRYLGTIGDIGCFSFHETKNYSTGEGGAIILNNPQFIQRAEIIREKGTNRSQFFRGEVDKYTWVDIGSSYLPSDIIAAILWNQFESIDDIQMRRKRIFATYYEGLKPLADKELLRLPVTNGFSNPNYHMFYIILPDEAQRNSLMDYLKANGILAVFHYIPLHLSPMGEIYGYQKGDFPITENISQRLLRLPIYNTLNESDQNYIISQIVSFFK